MKKKKLSCDDIQPNDWNYLQTSAARRKAARLFTEFGISFMSQRFGFNSNPPTENERKEFAAKFNTLSIPELIVLCCKPSMDNESVKKSLLIQKISCALSDPRFSVEARKALKENLLFYGYSWKYTVPTEKELQSDAIGMALDETKAKDAYFEDYDKGRRVANEVLYAATLYLLRYAMENDKILCVYGRDAEILYDAIKYTQAFIPFFEGVKVNYILVSRNQVALIKTAISLGKLKYGTDKKVIPCKKPFLVRYRNDHNQTIRSLTSGAEVRKFVDYINELAPANCIHVDTGFNGTIPKAIHGFMPKLGYSSYTGAKVNIRLLRSNDSQFRIPGMPDYFDIVDEIEHRPQRLMKSYKLCSGLSALDADRYHATKLGVFSYFKERLGGELEVKKSIPTTFKIVTPAQGKTEAIITATQGQPSMLSSSSINVEAIKAKLASLKAKLPAPIISDEIVKLTDKQKISYPAPKFWGEGIEYTSGNWKNKKV